MNFCSACGKPVSLSIPAGDSLPRHVCSNCGTVHYLNPKLVIGCVAEWQERILLCRRSIEPRYGLWTLPAGFMENDESTCEAARRETSEEACARVEIGPLFALVNIPHISQVHLFYRARLLDTNFAAGMETLETTLFAEDDIPWSSMAFQSVVFCLRAYFADRKSGHFTLHEHVIRKTKETGPEDATKMFFSGQQS
ncbi:MAG TPA: NUDIX hydrolase [Accumulibacter sp.]|nr:NUDIX hydrolase [Accumulibacter sp.]HMW16356.1 NUDIX hydrolase [Accumulibacter sp.]HMX22223.1 NUDIX hydrolase [Accumulibacter sp.]HMY06355.1 NUDIX hydrolase [Accumulibacter sp.]HNC17367.1 NUDIX hydrolase [Accumulibacter sp.]